MLWTGSGNGQRLQRTSCQSRGEVVWPARYNYAQSLYKDDDVTLDDLREATTTLEDTERTARRVLGGAHPFTTGIQAPLRNARAALRARETLSQLSPPPGSVK